MDLDLPELPYDRPPPLEGDGSRGRLAQPLADGGVGLHAVARSSDASAELIALAAWSVVMAGYGHQSSTGLALTRAGVVVALPLSLSGERTFADLVSHVQAGLASATETSSATTAFALEPIDPAAIPAGVELVVGVKDSPPTALVAWYSQERFDPATAARMLDHLAAVLAQLAAGGVDLRLDEIDILPPAERAQLAAWNATAVDYPADATLASLFADQVARTPEAVALEVDGRQLTYAALDELVQRVAVRLAAEGIGPGQLVGVLAERSVEMVAALHGVQRAGAGYVPLDPEYPAERIGYMLAETGMRLVLGQARFAALLADSGVPLIDLAALLDPDAPAPVGPTPTPPTPDDVAYVIYTSGSTGRPKGVANGQRGVVNRLLWMQDHFGLGPDGVALQKTPFSFDVSVWEFFWPLQVGARLVVAAPGGHRDPAYLVETITRHGVDTVHFVPSMLRLFLDHPAAASCTSLARIICSGEALTRDLVERCFAILPDAELHNLYGPTEAAVDVTAWQCRRDDPQPVVPIGAPIANTTIHILDARQQPVPIGVPGELYIGGVQVAHGYLNRPDLTAERFVPDPFAPPGRLYRTGDLARWLPSGQVDFLGRLDQQVKLRGQRIELGEIESVLGEHPAVLEAAVTVSQAGDDARLVAHIMWRDRPVDDAELRSSLAERLPAYMIPSNFVSMTTLPLTPSGKVDRNALSAATAKPSTGVMQPVGATAAAPSGSDLEGFLLDAWSSVLDRPVARDDRVFDLGATSLQAAAFVNRVQRELDEFIYVVTVFTSPTVAEYASFLAREYPAAVARRFGRAAPSVGTNENRQRVSEQDLGRMREIVPTFGPFLSWAAGKRNPPAVFILAPPRSGTTLLRVMLAGHPALFAASELQLLGFDTLSQRRTALDGRFSPWREGTIRAVMELKGLDADAATELMARHEAAGESDKEFFRWLQVEAGERAVVDKSPTYALDLEVLRNAERGFDDARYIHLVRDPLAVSRSFESYHMDQILFLHDHGWSGRALGELVWSLCHRNILAFSDEVPADRMLRVRFEELVTDPRAVMTRVAEFLGLDFREALVQPYQDLETKMVDGLHPESTPMGDTRLLERDRIDSGVATRWATVETDRPLGVPTLQLARALGYDAVAGAADPQQRRQRADDTRRRRLARRSGG